MYTFLDYLSDYVDQKYFFVIEFSCFSDKWWFVYSVELFLDLYFSNFYSEPL